MSRSLGKAHDERKRPLKAFQYEMANSSSVAALAVSNRHIICSEILSVTSAMRKNSRWASYVQTPLYVRDDALAASLGLRRAGGSPDAPSSSLRREVQLMSGFLELKREVLSTESMMHHNTHGTVI